MNKKASSKQKSARQEANTSRPDASAGPQGAAIAPPAYELDVLDSVQTDAGFEQEQATLPQPIDSLANRPVIQAKLTVGPVDDKYEQEADQVAAQVVSSMGGQGPTASGAPASATHGWFRGRRADAREALPK